MTDDPIDQTPREVALDSITNVAWNKRTRGVGGQAEFGPTYEFIRLAKFIFDEAVAWQRARPLPRNASDGYHTFNELYEYRMLYNAHAAHGWIADGIPVVKSWHHATGEECFGGGWFIVTATLPTGQVSNHYRAKYWDLFSVPEVDLPPEWDGHTPEEAAHRLHEHLTGE